LFGFYLMNRSALLILLTAAFAPSAPGSAAKVTLVPAPGSPLPISATCVAIADFNRDGQKDLLLTVGTHLQTCFGDGSGKFRTIPDRDLAVMLGDGRGGFASAKESVFPCGPSPYPPAAADVNGDGDLDILVPNSKPGVRTMTVLLGNGHGQFTTAPSSPIRTGDDDVYFVTVGDLNGDGRPDAFLSNNHNDHATILLNTGKGSFTRSPPLRMGNRGWHLAFLDFDLDGKPD